MVRGVSSALNFPFLKEISPNCFVFDVVNLNNEEGSQMCFVSDVDQVQKLRMSRRIASFLMLSSSKTKDASQSIFVFKLAERQIDR